MQKTFADLAWERKERKTRRETFLSEMERVIPWKELERIVKPYAPRETPGLEGGRPGHPVPVMLRIYFCQNWYQLSDDGIEDTLYDSESVRRFCLGNAALESIPDATTIARFRHVLERHKLQEKLFELVRKKLETAGIMTKTGTIVDATIIHAPSSTKNESKSRDPEMSQTRKGNQWYFGMKCHIGVDEESTTVHTVTATTAREADVDQFWNLLHGEETVAIGDRAYQSKANADELYLRDAELLTPIRKRKGEELSPRMKARNRKISARRAPGEHVFWVIKCLFGYRKTRYRGLVKNYLQQVTLLMLSNLYRVRRHPAMCCGA